jgi:hypothetical protein
MMGRVVAADSKLSAHKPFGSKAGTDLNVSFFAAKIAYAPLTSGEFDFL